MTNPFLYACAVLVAIVGSFMVITFILPSGFFMVRRPENRQRYADVDFGVIPEDWQTHATSNLEPLTEPVQRTIAPDASVGLMLSGLQGTDWRVMRASVLNLAAKGYLELLPASSEGYQLGGFTVAEGPRPLDNKLGEADTALLRYILSPSISNRRAGEATMIMQRYDKHYTRLAYRERYSRPYFPGGKRTASFVGQIIALVIGGIASLAFVEPAAATHETGLALAAVGISVLTGLVVRWLSVYRASLRPTAYFEALVAQVAAYRDYASKFPEVVTSNDNAAGWWFFYGLRHDAIDPGKNPLWLAAVEEARQDAENWIDRYEAS